MASKQALRPTQIPIQWVPGAFSSEVNRPGPNANNSPPSSAEVKNGGAVRQLFHTSSWHGAQLIKHWDEFTFIIIIIIIIIIISALSTVSLL
jgi:hypothetical protein